MSPLALQKGRAPCRRARALQKGAALQKGHGPAEGPRALQKGAACRRATLIYLCLRAPPFGSAFFAFELFGIRHGSERAVASLAAHPAGGRVEARAPINKAGVMKSRRAVVLPPADLLVAGPVFTMPFL